MILVFEQGWHVGQKYTRIRTNMSPRHYWLGRLLVMSIYNPLGWWWRLWPNIRQGQRRQCWKWRLFRLLPIECTTQQWGNQMFITIQPKLFFSIFWAKKYHLVLFLWNKCACFCLKFDTEIFSFTSLFSFSSPKRFYKIFQARKIPWSIDA